MKVKFSKTTDIIAEEKAIRLSKYLQSIADWQEMDNEQAAMFYTGEISIPERKQRKAFTLELEDTPPPTDEQLAEQAQSEMITELNWVDLQLKYHSTGDTKRAVSSVELLNAYAIQCRDHVHNTSEGLVIVGDKPSRPE